MAALSVYSLWKSDHYTGRSRRRQDNDGTSDYCKLTRGEPILPVTDKTKTKEKRSDEVDSENEDLDAEDNMQEQSSVSPVNVIYQTAEDGLGDTIKPRLLAAGADCSKVLVIDDSDQPLTMADVRLEEAIVQTKAKWLFLIRYRAFWERT